MIHRVFCPLPLPPALTPAHFATFSSLTLSTSGFLLLLSFVSSHVSACCTMASYLTFILTDIMRQTEYIQGIVYG